MTSPQHDLILSNHTIKQDVQGLSALFTQEFHTHVLFYVKRHEEGAFSTVAIQFATRK